MANNQTDNKMGTEPIPKVMLQMGIPVICSMVLQACYNIIDSIFVGQIEDYDGIRNAGELALNALTLSYPIQMLIIAFGIGTGVGVNALLANFLGQNDREHVAKTAGNGVTLGILIYIAFMIFGFVGIDGYLHSQTTNTVVFEMAHSYLRICCIFSVGSVMFAIYEKLLQSTGRTGYSTIAQVIGAGINIALDPILIFGLLGMPKLGVSGAAYATIIGQIASLLVAGIFHYTKSKEIKFGFRYLLPDGSIIRRIYVIGLPAIIMQALMSFMTYAINLIFGTISEAAVTAYGIFYKIQQFAFFAAFGIRDVETPIIAYNYGARKKRRIQQGMRTGMLFTEVIMIAAIVILEIFALPLAAAFGLSDSTARLCALAIRIIVPGFLFAGGNIAMQGMFQALGCGMSSLIVSALRLAVIVLPLAYVFTLLPNALTMIWLAFPIAEAGAFVVSVFLLLRAKRKILVPMQDKDTPSGPQAA